MKPPAGCTAMAMGWKVSGNMATPKIVPAPNNSRTQLKSVIARVKPSPMPSPSSMEASGGFLKAKDSARAKMMQFTTISDINTPSVSYRSGKNACITISTTVTNVAITITKAGMRICSGIMRRNSEITRLENTSTNVVAKPIAMPLVA